MVQDYKRSVSVTWALPVNHLCLLFVSRAFAYLPTETVIVILRFVVVVFFPSTVDTEPTPTPSLHQAVFVHAHSLEDNVGLSCNVPRLVSLLLFSMGPWKFLSLFTSAKTAQICQYSQNPFYHHFLLFIWACTEKKWNWGYVTFDVLIVLYCCDIHFSNTLDKGKQILLWLFFYDNVWF